MDTETKFVLKFRETRDDKYSERKFPFDTYHEAEMKMNEAIACGFWASILEVQTRVKDSSPR
jgi:hypothetical protein